LGLLLFDNRGRLSRTFPQKAFEVNDEKDTKTACTDADIAGPESVDATRVGGGNVGAIAGTALLATRFEGQIEPTFNFLVWEVTRNTKKLRQSSLLVGRALTGCVLWPRWYCPTDGGEVRGSRCLLSEAFIGRGAR
jgi:hypothetical protein